MSHTTNFRFSEAINRLNLGQKEAVESIEGPVMVLAGPGTGKTQILASRIGMIMEQTDTSPDQILCLTFTDAGSAAMRRRLIQLIGASGHQVHIHTFHSFCNWVIQSNPEYFPTVGLENMTALEEVELAEEVLNGLPPQSDLRNLKSSTKYVNSNLRKLFSIMKQEEWSPEKVDTLIESYKEEIMTKDEFRYQRKYKEFSKGDLRQAKYDEEVKKMEKLSEAAHLLPKYEALKKANGKYDFSDMLLWVTQAFKESEELLLDYQEKFQYILVDEYQDTSHIQQEVIDQLISYWGDVPNIFVVGDDDQSIFRFQGANVQNIIDFSRQFSNHLSTVVLDRNYRSTQQILNVAQTLIEHNHSRLIDIPEYEHLSKVLTAHDEKAGPKVKVLGYINEVHEAVSIGDQVIDLIESGVPSSEIAILYREHKNSELVMSYLKYRGVPIKTRRKANVFDLPIVKAYLEALRFVIQENKDPFSGDPFLFKLLHYDTKIKPIDASKLMSLKERKRRAGVYLSLRELLSLVQKDIEIQSSFLEPKSLIDFFDQLEEWVRDSHLITPTALAELILHSGGFIDRAILSNQKGFLLEALNTVFHFIQEEARKKPEYSLENHLETIDLMIQHEVWLPIEEIIDDENGVNFITAHSSKGLEFEAVFLISCEDKVWKSEVNRKPFSLQKVLPGEPDEILLEENRRLFYVALTRAKSILKVSYSKASTEGKEKKFTPFISEILESDDCLEEEVHVNTDSVVWFLQQGESSTDKKLNTVLDDPLLDERLESYVLSVTHLNNYLRCPIDFFFNSLLRVPSMKNKHMSYGTAVHKALEKIIQERATENYTADNFLGYFKKWMEKERYTFTDQEFIDLNLHGEQTLEPYFNTYKEVWRQPDDILTEFTIDNVLVNDVPIKGQLDKVELFGKSVNVVDYKTGQPKNAKPKLKGPDESAAEDAPYEKIYGGDYWRQLVFYSLLVEGEKKKGWVMQSGEMDFIEKDQKDEFFKFKWFPTDEDKEIVAGQIREVYGKIMKKDFDQGCGKDDCDWCNFVAEYY